MRISDWSSDVCSSDLVDSVLLSAASGGSAAMMRLPSVEDRLSRRLAEGHHRHVAAECELVRLDPQRLARFDRRDRVPANMQQRVKEAEDRERPQIEADGVAPSINRAAIADSAGKAADEQRPPRITLSIGRDLQVEREARQVAPPA